ncbi:MAG: cell wall hydrolase [Hespellia sp.]|nr:cell wall hydrolase [Hespellia sp.]
MKMRFKCKLHACTAIACTLLLTFSVLPVAAEDDIKSLENTTSNLQNQLNSINSELDQISTEITDIQMQVEVTSAEIDRTKAALNDAKEEELQQYEDMKARIKYMYESGNVSLLQMLFSAENMSDFLNKAEFIQNISDYDRNMLDELQAVRQKVEDEQKTLTEQQDSLKELQANLEEKQDSLKAKAKATSTDLAKYQKQLEDARAAEAARQKAAAEAAAAAAAVSNNNAQQTVSGGTTTNTGASMNVDASELDIFAAILDCEAVSDYNSMLAVATVIMNRVNSSNFPNSISGVVYAPGQFQPVWTGKLDRRLESGPSSLAYSVAQDALNGARLAEVSNCYYFLYAPATSRQGIVIGDNLFFASW